MIIVALKEGLGNQLFQYFFAKGYEGANVLFDISFYLKGNISATRRTADLYNFPRLKVDLYNLEPVEGNYIKDNFQYIGDTILDPNQNYYFDGYWHDKRYLQKVEEKIKDELLPDDDIKDYLFGKYPFLKNEECVSLHVRRSDYLNLSSFYHQLDLDYYNNALDFVGRDKKVIIFSDDIRWCKENFKIKNLEFIEEPNHVDLSAMSLCQHNIIANSSFSFWGAYINQNIDKKVVAPKLWYTQEYSLLISNFTNKDCAADIILDTWDRL